MCGSVEGSSRFPGILQSLILKAHYPEQTGTTGHPAHVRDLAARNGQLREGDTARQKTPVTGQMRQGGWRGCG